VGITLTQKYQAWDRFIQRSEINFHGGTAGR
jgi:hypothetical protein